MNGVGAKKFGMSLETREVKLVWQDIPGFCWAIPAVPANFEKTKLVFNFWPLVESRRDRALKNPILRCSGYRM